MFHYDPHATSQTPALKQFLPSVVASTYLNKKVVLIDNASTDDSLHLVQSDFPAVEIVRNKLNFGFAKGYNEGLKEVKADYYILLNSDVEVQPGWIEPAIELMESDAAKISVRTSYNLSSMSFSPKEIAAAIKKHVPERSVLDTTT